MRSFKALAVLALVLVGLVPLASAQAPAIFFTDLDSGPNSGGESVSGFSGAYVTIYGNFLGTTQGASSVTWNGLSCLRVVSWGTTWNWYQKIVVQLGSSCTNGSGNFVVTVSGQASNGVPFTVRSGNIYCAASGGSNSNNGHFGSCWADVYQAIAAMSPGDITYFLNGYTETRNSGAIHSNHCVAAMYSSGTSGNPKAFVAYPGATVTFQGNGPSDPSFGFCLYADYLTVAGFNLRATTSAGRIQSADAPGGNSDRLIGNDVTCNDASSCANGRDACVATDYFNNTLATESHILGNNIHDVCTVNQTNQVVNGGKYQHAVYLGDQSQNMEFGWNQIINNYSNRALQVYSSTAPAMHDLYIHDNYVYNSRGEGLLVGSNDPSLGPVRVWNNVVIKAGMGPGFGTDGINNPHCADAGDSNAGSSTHPQEWYNNTFYDCACDKSSWTGSCQYDGSVFTQGGTGNSFIWKNNISYAVNTPYLVLGSGGSANSFQNASASVCSNNVWFGYSTTPSGCSASVTSNPLLASASTGDAHLQSTSPAISAGVSLSGLVPWDHDGLLRPNPPSIGAYEPSSVTVQRPNPPTNLAVTVN